MPSAHSPDRSATRSNAGRKQTWPLPGTLLFTGADLEAAMAAAAAELGDDVEVTAARSVKQGLRGKTHVEVLVTRPAVAVRPPLPPSEQPQRALTARRGATRGRDADPVESTLAALLASAEAEEDELQRLATADREVDLRVGPETSSTVVPFDPPQLPGNPSFAAEFAAAFPAALAAAQAADTESHPAGLERHDRRPVAADDDFTARVREALRRVPQEDDTPPAGLSLGFDDTDELEIIQPSSGSAQLPRSAIVRASHVQPAHPAPELIDAPPSQPMPGPQAQAMPVPQPQADRGRRPRPFPGPLAMAGRPAGLQRPAGSGWSMVRLRDLGVPEAVLAALPAEEPSDDLRWLVALTDAITATVPAPAEDGTADVAASGTGLRGALALLRLGAEGVPPQTLTIEGRAVPATATELALAVRAGILR